MTIPHETARVRSGDVTLHYRRLGRAGGVPLLIVHGLSYFSYDWLPAAQALGAEREVIAMDMRGFGDSDCSAAKDYGVATMGADILAVLDHAGWRQALLAGHSMGARSTIWVAAKHAARVAGLALIDYSPENAPAGSRRVTEKVANTPDAFASVEQAMQYFGKGERARFEQYLKKTDRGYVPKRDPHFREQFRRALETGERPKLGVDMWQLLAEVRCPILSMRGARSDMYAPETAQKMKAANARLEVVEVDAGHDIAGDNLPGFLAALESWLQKMGSDPISAQSEKNGVRPHFPGTRGVDHLAIVTDDMPTAMDFYTRVVGFRLVHVRRVPFEQDRWQPPYDNLRHYFFDMGNDSLFAIFEYPKGLPRQVRDHVGGMQHVAFHVPPERFDAMVAHVKACGVEVRGPVPLGGRFWSAYFLDPFGTRLELATDRSGVRQGVVASVLQSEEEARAELETLFSDPAEVEKWLARMPLKREKMGSDPISV